ncbi:MAG: hypothetical protein ACK55I_46720, partial [bacterium]
SASYSSRAVFQRLGRSENQKVLRCTSTRIDGGNLLRLSERRVTPLLRSCFDPQSCALHGWEAGIEVR